MHCALCRADLTRGLLGYRTYYAHQESNVTDEDIHICLACAESGNPKPTHIACSCVDGVHTETCPAKELLAKAQIAAGATEEIVEEEIVEA